MTRLLHAEQLTLIRGQRLLFRQLSLTLHAGQAIQLSGENGAGKTSLCQLLAGLLRANQGRIQRHPTARLRYLGHQTTIQSMLTVAENLYFNNILFDDNADALAAHKQALSALNLARFSDYPCSKLSAGQQRRVMLARLWLSEPARYPTIWLLDEPLTALDNTSVAVVQQRLDALLAAGDGVIFTSHQALTLKHPVSRLPLGMPL